IELAASTGAATELVSAFSTIKPSLISPLVNSGLERLTISLHTTDPVQFREVYGSGSFDDLRKRLQELLRVREECGSSVPKLDIAFVAMRRNLGQLMHVADFAATLGIERISVLPVIRRDPIPETFERELRDGRLLPSFQNELCRVVQATRNRFPTLQVDLSSPEIGATEELNSSPRPYPGTLPAEGRIHTCEQNPWETIHILANGEAVVCEVQDQAPVGDLKRESLDEIWNGPSYRQFRNQYVTGQIAKCRSCIYKQAWLPGSPSRSIESSEGVNAQLSWGWHPPDSQGVLWSKRESHAILGRDPGDRRVGISGILPNASSGDLNVLTVSCNDRILGRVENNGTNPVSFRTSFALDRDQAKVLQLRFSVRQALRPSRVGAGTDQRELGFALGGIEATPGTRRSFKQWIRRIRYLPLWLTIELDRRLSRRGRIRNRLPLEWFPGVSVIIPERDSPEMLQECVGSVFRAASTLNEAVEVVVVTNGCDRAEYFSLKKLFPELIFIHSDPPLSFTRAILAGLKVARYGGVYLLNSDVILEEEALHEVLKWRSPNVSAVASQILEPDPTRRREETGWTQLQVQNLQIELVDLFPEDETTVRGNLYAGGGASLFHRDLLKRILGWTDPYAPFYWEDVDWGLRSWRMGYEVLFSPASKAQHRHRATVSRYYAPAEIRRIFQRNALQFELRNRLTGADSVQLVRTVRRLDPQSKKELASLRNCGSLLFDSLHSLVTGLRPWRPELAFKKVYRNPIVKDRSKPCLLIVSPFAIYPPRHGGAVRTQSLVRELARDFQVVIVSDEADQYGSSAEIDETICSLHLVRGRKELPTGTASRKDRIRSHCHPALIKELDRVLTVYSPSIIQLEHIELAGLIESGLKRDLIWSLMLHDVYLTESSSSQDDLYEKSLLSQFDQLFAVSPEDVELLKGFDVAVIPNGIDLHGASYTSSRGSSTILFMGPFRYRPNLEGIRLFLQRVYPQLRLKIPEVDLVILGGKGAMQHLADLNPEHLDKVTVLDSVPETRSWLERSAVTINPLYGIRGSSIKLLESLAAGRVCVSTLEGARGFSSLPLRSLLTVPSIEGFAAVLERLIKDEEHRISLERPPLEQLEQLTWAKSGQKLRETYASILAGRSQ
ncbi:MAG: glycosyltransferase, partial [Acidobacteriota bacterium]